MLSDLSLLARSSVMILGWQVTLLQAGLCCLATSHRLRAAWSTRTALSLRPASSSSSLIRRGRSLRHQP